MEMEVMQVKLEPLDYDLDNTTHDPSIMNTVEDARKFWDEMVTRMNNDSRCSTRNFSPAINVASREHLSDITDELNDFIDEMKKIRSIRPEFIDKYTFLFNGFINLWRKETKLAPIQIVTVSEVEEAGNELTLNSDEKHVPETQPSRLVRQLSSADSCSKTQHSGCFRRILPKDMTREVVVMKRTRDGFEKGSANTLRNISQCTAADGSPSGKMAIPALVQRRFIEAKHESLNKTHSPTSIHMPAAAPKKTLPNDTVPTLFVRLANGRFAPVAKTATVSGRPTHNVVTTNNVSVNDYVNRDGRLVSTSSGGVMSSYDAHRRTLLQAPAPVAQAPAKKLARIAPAPSQEVPTPKLETQRTGSLSRAYEADITISRPHESFFQTTVTVDKSNGQGCITDTNTMCKGGKMSLRGICGLGNFDKVRVDDLLLEFGQDASDSSVKLKIIFRKN